MYIMDVHLGDMRRNVLFFGCQSWILKRPILLTPLGLEVLENIKTVKGGLKHYPSFPWKYRAD